MGAPTTRIFAWTLTGPATALGRFLTPHECHRHFLRAGSTVALSALSGPTRALLASVTAGGLLAGVTVSGVLMGMFQNNAGGAWDNAKKSFEAGVEINGKMEYKGSDAHKASVTGDTVGDPFKDTSGPSMNILIKLMSIVALIIAPHISLNPNHGSQPKPAPKAQLERTIEAPIEKKL